MNTFLYKHDVRLREADLAGHVFYANYLAYLDDARHFHLRKLGYNLEKMRKEDFIFVVSDLNCQFLKPAEFEDQLFIYMRFERVRSKGMKIKHVICTEEASEADMNKSFDDFPAPCHRGETGLVAVKLSSKRPVDLPSGLAALFS